MIPNLSVTGMKKAERFFGQASTNVKKAFPAASKAVGFKYSKVLQQEMKRGAPGGSKWKPLTVVMKRYRQAKSLSGRTPYKQMAGAVRYSVDPTTGVLRIGLLDRGPQKASRSWLAKARGMQSGKPVPVTGVKRKFFGKYGGTWGKASSRSGGWSGGRSKKTYALHKERRFLRPPRRLLIEPFARAHERDIFRDFEQVYFAKLAGRFAKI